MRCRSTARAPLFTDAERAALDYATELTGGKKVEPGTFARLARYYSERPWREDLPPDPRDPDVVRVKALARVEMPHPQTAGRAVRVPRAQ
jgi:hypothetical protein